MLSTLAVTAVKARGGASCVVPKGIRARSYCEPGETWTAPGGGPAPFSAEMRGMCVGQAARVRIPYTNSVTVGKAVSFSVLRWPLQNGDC